MPEDVSIEVDSQKIARDELRKRIDDSGLGVTRFSKERLIRDPSTVHRYLSGTSPIPEIVISYLLGDWRIRDSAAK